MSRGTKGKKSNSFAEDDQSTSTAVVPDGRTSREFAVLPLSAVQESVQPFPPDPKAISDQKAAISIGGQSLLVTVRKHEDGRLEQLDGFHCTTALKELGRSNVSAVVVSGLTDWEADFRRLAGYLSPNLRALDKALLLAQLLELRAQNASQDATPLGGRQPTDK